MRRIEKYYNQKSNQIREQLMKAFPVYSVVNYKPIAGNIQNCVREYFLELVFFNSDLDGIQVSWNMDGTFSIDQEVLPYYFWEKEQALKCVELFLDSPFTISIKPLVQFNGLPGYCVIISKEYISSVTEVIEILKKLKSIIIKIHDELVLLDYPSK